MASKEDAERAMWDKSLPRLLKHPQLHQGAQRQKTFRNIVNFPCHTYQQQLFISLKISHNSNRYIQQKLRNIQRQYFTYKCITFYSWFCFISINITYYISITPPHVKLELCSYKLEDVATSCRKSFFYSCPLTSHDLAMI